MHFVLIFFVIGLLLPAFVLSIPFTFYRAVRSIIDDPPQSGGIISVLISSASFVMIIATIDALTR